MDLLIRLNAQNWRTIRRVLIILSLIVITISCVLIIRRPVPRYETLYFFSAIWTLLWALAFHPDRNTDLRRPLSILLSSLLLAWAFPPYPAIFAFTAFVPIWLLLDHHRKNKIKSIWVVRDLYLIFLGFNIFSTYWIANTAFGASVFAFSVNALLMAITVWLFYSLSPFLSRALRMFFFIFIWIAFEYLHHHWEMSWIWLTLGNALSSIPWAIQWYEYTGVFGGTLWILLVNYGVYKLWLTPKRHIAITISLLLITPILLSYWIKHRSAPILSKDSINAVLINPNIEPNFEFQALTEEETISRLQSTLEKCIDNSTELIVIPEGALGNLDLNRLAQYPIVQALHHTAQKYNTHILAGVSGRQIFPNDNIPNRSSIRIFERGKERIFWETYNNAILLSPNEEKTLIYNKKKMVPGAENFPYKNLLWFLAPIVEAAHGNMYGHGSYARDEVFPIPNTKAVVAPIICYEGDYGSHCRTYVHRGANIMALITEDGWWEQTKGHIQHLYINRLRAIETRRYIARAANYGHVTVIDPHGDFIVNPSAYGEQYCQNYRVPLINYITFYVKWGDFIGRISLGISIFLIAIALANSWQKSQRHDFQKDN